ncbi:MAG: AAA family ATPase [Akkermansiaceae bacterium]|nr:AAA family ATPase [Akkermansiaceae bacterium]
MKFDPDQKVALARINEGRNVFLTGAAGTGKSSVTVEMIRRRISDRSLKVCATTGVAALNLRDKLQALFGQHVDTSTVYRWSGIGLGPREGQSFDDYLSYMRTRKLAWQNACRRIRGTTTLVVDEVSMLPGRILEFVDFVCREIRSDPRPFGGIQVIAVGDFLQLPPVAKTGRYDWAFLSPAWNDLAFSCVSLRTVHRQDDPDFISILNQFREGTVTKEGAAILKKRVALFPKSVLLRLFTHNTQVDKWNAYQLGALDGHEHVFHAEGHGPREEIEWLQKNLVTPTELKIKAGARVMVTANLADPNQPEALMAANGDLGTVAGWDAETVRVALDSGRDISVPPHEWEFDPTVTATPGMETGVFIQFPLRLAWACTIHKSQGLTLDSALVDIRAAREPGQAYVAVSRVKSLSGLHLKDWFSGMFISPQAKEFHRRVVAGETGDSSAPSFRLS